MNVTVKDLLDAGSILPNTHIMRPLPLPKPIGSRFAWWLWSTVIPIPRFDASGFRETTILQSPSALSWTSSWRLSKGRFPSRRGATRRKDITPVAQEPDFVDRIRARGDLARGYDEMDFDDRKRHPRPRMILLNKRRRLLGTPRRRPGSPTKLKTLPRPLQRPPKKNLERHPQKESLKKTPEETEKDTEQEPEDASDESDGSENAEEGIHPTKNLPVTNRSTFLSIQNFIFSIIKYHVYI